MRRIALLAWLLSASFVHGAVGAPANQFKVANWTGGTYSTDQSKRPEYCSATSANANGIAIAYSIDRRHNWRLRFSNAAWNFSQGLTLNLILRAGERDSMRGRAIAVDRQALEVEVEDDIALFARLRIGERLGVTAGGLNFEFPLADSDDVLSALTQCAIRHLGIAQVARPKRSASEKSPPPLLAADPTAAEEVKALAVDIVRQARIADSRPLPGNELPAEWRGAAGWKAGLVTSAIAVVRPNETVKPEDMSDKVIDTDARRCPGGFFFVAALDAVDQTTVVARVFTSCKDADAVTSTYHVAVPRHKGGAYLVSSTSRGGGFGGVVQLQAEQIDAKVRSVIMAALRRQEQDSGTAKQ